MYLSTDRLPLGGALMIWEEMGKAGVGGEEKDGESPTCVFLGSN
jgi:hypothetical protein